MPTSHRSRIHWQYSLGILLGLGFILIALAAPVLSPEDPKHPGPEKIVGRVVDHHPHPPSPKAPLGTLPGQASIYHTLIWGTRSALSFGLLTALLTATIGILAGTFSAYLGGKINDIIMRISDAFLAFPVIAGVVLIQQVTTIILTNAGVYETFSGLGGVAGTMQGFETAHENLSLWLTILHGINPVMMAFILFSWPAYARMMNTTTQRLLQTEYIQAAHSLGASHLQIIFKHLIPNAMAPAIILAARDVGGMVLLQATFTFIGLGGESFWGMLLVRGRNWIIGPGGSILTYWWLFLPATLALVLFGISWNLIGDALNEMLEPR